MSIKNDESKWSDDYSDNESELWFGGKKKNSISKPLKVETPEKKSVADELNFSMDSFTGSELVTTEYFTFKNNSFGSKALKQRSSNITDFTFMKPSESNQVKEPVNLDLELLPLNPKICWNIDKTTNPELFEPIKVKKVKRYITPKHKRLKRLCKVTKTSSDTNLIAKKSKNITKKIISNPKQVKSKSKKKNKHKRKSKYFVFLVSDFKFCNVLLL